MSDMLRRFVGGWGGDSSNTSSRRSSTAGELADVSSLTAEERAAIEAVNAKAAADSTDSRGNSALSSRCASPLPELAGLSEAEREQIHQVMLKAQQLEQAARTSISDPRRLSPHRPSPLLSQPPVSDLSEEERYSSGYYPLVQMDSLPETIEVTMAPPPSIAGSDRPPSRAGSSISVDDLSEDERAIIDAVVRRAESEGFHSPYGSIVSSQRSSRRDSGSFPPMDELARSALSEDERQQAQYEIASLTGEIQQLVDSVHLDTFTDLDRLTVGTTRPPPLDVVVQPPSVDLTAFSEEERAHIESVLARASGSSPTRSAPEQSAIGAAQLPESMEVVVEEEDERKTDVEDVQMSEAIVIDDFEAVQPDYYQKGVAFQTEEPSSSFSPTQPSEEEAGEAAEAEDQQKIEDEEEEGEEDEDHKYGYYEYKPPSSDDDLPESEGEPSPPPIPTSIDRHSPYFVPPEAIRPTTSALPPTDDRPSDRGDDSALNDQSPENPPMDATEWWEQTTFEEFVDQAEQEAMDAGKYDVPDRRSIQDDSNATQKEEPSSVSRRTGSVDAASGDTPQRKYFLKRRVTFQMDHPVEIDAEIEDDIYSDEQQLDDYEEREDEAILVLKRDEFDQAQQEQQVEWNTKYDGADEKKATIAEPEVVAGAQSLLTDVDNTDVLNEELLESHDDDELKLADDDDKRAGDRVASGERSIDQDAAGGQIGPPNDDVDDGGDEDYGDNAALAPPVPLIDTSAQETRERVASPIADQLQTRIRFRAGDLTEQRGSVDESTAKTDYDETIGVLPAASARELPSVDLSCLTDEERVAQMEAPTSDGAALIIAAHSGAVDLEMFCASEKENASQYQRELTERSESDATEGADETAEEAAEASDGAEMGLADLTEAERRYIEMINARAAELNGAAATRTTEAANDTTFNSTRTAPEIDLSELTTPEREQILSVLMKANNYELGEDIPAPSTASAVNVSERDGHGSEDGRDYFERHERSSSEETEGADANTATPNQLASTPPPPPLSAAVDNSQLTEEELMHISMVLNRAAQESGGPTSISFKEQDVNVPVTRPETSGVSYISQTSQPLNEVAERQTDASSEMHFDDLTTPEREQIQAVIERALKESAPAPQRRASSEDTEGADEDTELTVEDEDVHRDITMPTLTEADRQTLAETELEAETSSNLLKKRESSEETEGADDNEEERLSSSVASTPPPLPASERQPLFVSGTEAEASLSHTNLAFDDEEHVTSLLEDAMTDTSAAEIKETTDSERPSDIHDLLPATAESVADEPAIRFKRNISEETEGADSTSSGEHINIEEVTEEQDKDSHRPVLHPERTVSEETESADSASSPELLDYPDVQGESKSSYLPDQPSVDLTGLSEEERRVIESVISRAAAVGATETEYPERKSPTTSDEYEIVEREDVTETVQLPLLPHSSLLSQTSALESTALSEEEVRQIEAVMARAAAAESERLVIAPAGAEKDFLDGLKMREEARGDLLLPSPSAHDVTEKRDSYRSPSTYSPVDSSETDGADADEEMSPEPTKTSHFDYPSKNAEEEDIARSPDAQEYHSPLEVNVHAPGASSIPRHIEDISEVDIIDAVRSDTIPEEEEATLSNLSQLISPEEVIEMDGTQRAPEELLITNVPAPGATEDSRRIGDVVEVDIVDAFRSELETVAEVEKSEDAIEATSAATVEEESQTEEDTANNIDVVEYWYLEYIQMFADMLARRAIQLGVPEATEELQLISRFEDRPVRRAETTAWKD
uniref:Uncharacterized protein n=1 Tax=Plectus sambesii TaxID=2011161 RepID=A0A914X046_9BILA